MNRAETNPISWPRLTKREFKRLGSFIQSNFGIKMPDSKRLMIESRLRKRLKILNIDSYSEYCDFLFSNQGQSEELRYFIDVVTTNKTDFFREPHHFEYLQKNGLPELMHSAGDGTKTVSVWSSACSKGDEPYTLAMVLSEFGRKTAGFDFSILATDISMNVLEYARKGVYPHSDIETVPLKLRQKYLLKSKDRKEDLIRIVPKLREKVTFRQINLIESDFRKISTMDIIFCRNVIIYFDRDTTIRLIRKLCQKLKKGGLLFMGHSELLDCNLYPIVQVAPTIYRKI